VKIDLQVEVEGPFPLDPNGIFRCLLNLLTNAVDAAPKVGGRVVVAARLDQGTSLVIDVSDNGPGVPEEAARRIFEPFFSTKGSHGTGLGLAVTQKIVEEHGGHIELGRGPEGGALFRMTIPGRAKPTREDHCDEEGVIQV
jgi:signal transduction histidine kinase